MNLKPHLIRGSNTHALYKILLIMKLIIVFLTAAIFQVSAKSFAQKITLNKKDVSLNVIIKEIRNQSGYDFIYNLNLLKKANPISINVQNAELKDVLDLCFKNQPFVYALEDKAVIVKEKKELQANLPVNGTVIDKDGNPLAGVSVTLKGENKGTQTDANGSFTLSVITGNTLVFSYLGFISQEISYSDQKTIDVVLKESLESLNEIVVVGYGIQKKSDVTSAISSIKSEDFNGPSISDFRQGISGKLAGVQVMQTSGTPGGEVSIRIRGTNSATAGNNPLYVIDGVPLENFNLNHINSNDIESLEVLKDASSAAIYGSRGANGVVIITTKKGSAGKTKINFDLYTGIQDVSKKIKLLDAYEYAKLSKDAHDNAYLDEIPGASPDDPNNIRPQSYHKIPEELLPYINGVQGLTNTDWQDEVFRTAPVQNFNVSISNKGKALDYFVSGNYYKQEGVVINSDFTKYNARVNLNGQEKKLKFGMNFNPTYTQSIRVPDGQYTSDGVVASALSYSPTWPVYNEDGTYNFQGNGYWRIGNDYQHNEILNPVAIANLTEDKVDRVSLLGNVFAEYEFIEGLSYNVSLGGNFNSYHNDYYRPSTLPTRGWQYYGLASNPTAYSSSTMYFNWVWENKLSYTKSFKDHNLNAILVYSAQKETAKNNRVEATDFPNDMIHTITGGKVVDGTSGIQEWALNSYLSRVQYNYKSKYMLTGAIRADGSSRFGKNNRWGYFPSVSAGWRISQEDFMKDISFIDDIKLRGSLGTTGNFQIGNYEHIARVSVEEYVLGTGDGTVITGYKPSNVENNDLSWEKTKMANFGLDVSVKNSLLGLSFDVYNSNTEDMLLNVPVPHTSGYSTARMNIGKVNNKGYEISLNSRKKFGDFSYLLAVNYSANKNTVKALGPGNTPIVQSGSVDHAYYITQVGSPIGSYYFLVQDGIFSTQEQLDRYPHFANTHVGDFRFVDVDKDGVLDTEKDRTIVGNYMPDFTYGLNGNLQYKTLDLSFAFQGVEGNEILNLNRRYNDNMEGNFNGTVLALNRWQSESNSGDGNVNRANRKAKGNNGRTSTWHLEDGSYLRLQYITLGYTFPKQIIKKADIDKLRLYVSAQNLFTWTNYTGYNPEVSNRPNNALTPGEDYGTYPLTRIFSFGLNLSF